MSQDDDKTGDETTAEGAEPKKRKLQLTKRVLRHFGVRSGVQTGLNDGLDGGADGGSFDNSPPPPPPPPGSTPHLYRTIAVSYYG